MALGTKTTNSASEAMRGLLQELAYIKSFPDADLEFLTGIESSILEKLKAPIAQHMAQYGPGGSSPTAPGGGMAQMGTQMNPMVAQLAQGVPGGLRNAGTTPPVDELRRLLSGAA